MMQHAYEVKVNGDTVGMIEACSDEEAISYGVKYAKEHPGTVRHGEGFRVDADDLSLGYGGKTDWFNG